MIVDLPLALLIAQLIDLLLVMLDQQFLNVIAFAAFPVLLWILIHVDDVIVIVVLHQDGFDVLESALGVGVVEVVNDNTKGLLLVIDYIILLLIIFQLFIGQIREDL
jgi:hypothetical protein